MSFIIRKLFNPRKIVSTLKVLKQAEEERAILAKFVGKKSSNQISDKIDDFFLICLCSFSLGRSGMAYLEVTPLCVQVC